MQEVMQSGQANREVETVSNTTTHHVEEKPNTGTVTEAAESTSNEDRLEKLRQAALSGKDVEEDKPAVKADKKAKEVAVKEDSDSSAEEDKKELLSPKLAKLNSDLRKLELKEKEVSDRTTQINEFIDESKRDPKAFAKFARSIGVEFESPLDLAEAFGYKPEDFVLASMNGNKPDEKTLERRRQEKYYQELEEVKKTIKEKELAAQEQQKQSIIEYNNRLLQQTQQVLADYLVDNKDRYEVTVETYGGQGLELVFNYLVQKYPNVSLDRINQHFEEAAEEVEKELTKEAEKITKLKKFQTNTSNVRSTEVAVSKPDKANVAKDKSSKPTVTTNTNSDKPLSRKDFATEEQYSAALKKKLGIG